MNDALRLVDILTAITLGAQVLQNDKSLNEESQAVVRVILESADRGFLILNPAAILEAEELSSGLG